MKDLIQLQAVDALVEGGKHDPLVRTQLAELRMLMLSVGLAVIARFQFLSADREESAEFANDASLTSFHSFRGARLYNRRLVALIQQTDDLAHATVSGYEVSQDDLWRPFDSVQLKPKKGTDKDLFLELIRTQLTGHLQNQPSFSLEHFHSVLAREQSAHERQDQEFAEQDMPRTQANAWKRWRIAGWICRCAHSSRLSARPEQSPVSRA